MDRQQMFNSQLACDNERVKSQLLSETEWAWLRSFYNHHFDEISGLLNDKNLRSVIEDFCLMEPTLSSALIENNLFVYQVNLAIYKRVLKEEDF